MAAPMAVPGLEGEPGSQGNWSNDLFYKKKKKEVQKPLDLSLIGLKEGLRKNRETFLISSHIALGVISLGE